jgi:eukaryotic-like serine/threonine-protein kinase
MNTLMPVPCPQWEKQLAALHPDDLSPAERKALAAHTAVCPVCAAVLADYQRLQELTRQALIFEPPLPLWDNHAQKAFQNPLALPGRSPGAGDQTASSGSPSRNTHPLSELSDPSRLNKQIALPVEASLITAPAKSSQVEVLPAGVTIRDPAGERYVIETLLGEGGSGAVYLVRDQSASQKRFALKEVINPDKHDRERFTFEGQVLWRLEHKALPRVYRVFEDDKLRRVYMLMDYIEGPNLEALQKEQPEQRFPLALALALLAPIVDALTYLHHQDPPIVHRDVKPANIIVPMKGEGAVLVDFGIAKEFVEDKTTNVIRHGSPGYAAPEQYGGGTNPRTDLYGLAATLYTMLTGVIPPDAITRATRSKSLDPLRPVNLLVPGIALEVAGAIERAMSISIDDRFETIEQFWQELQGIPTGEWITVAPPMPSLVPRSLPEQNRGKIMTLPLRRERPKREVRRRGILLPVGLALLLCMIGAGVSLLAFASRDSSSPPASHTATPVRTPSIAAPTVNVGVFPQLATSYAGTILDLLSNQKTPLFLTNIKQSGGTIQGSFQGLGLIGPFKGTVSTSGSVHFTVSVYGGTETLSFEGTIKIGGDIVGTFDALDPNGNKMGESGIWNVGPHP